MQLTLKVICLCEFDNSFYELKINWLSFVPILTLHSKGYEKQKIVIIYLYIMLILYKKTIYLNQQALNYLTACMRIKSNSSKSLYIVRCTPLMKLFHHLLLPKHVNVLHYIVTEPRTELCWARIIQHCKGDMLLKMNKICARKFWTIEQRMPFLTNKSKFWSLFVKIQIYNCCCVQNI